MVCFFSLVSIICSGQIQFKKTSWLLLLLLLFNIIGIIFTPADFASALKWCLSLLAVFSFGAMLTIIIIDIKRIVFIALVPCLFFVVGIFLNVLNPSLILKINSLTLKGGSLESFVELTSYGYYPGFSGFTVVSGFFSGAASIIFLTISFSKKGFRKVIYLLLCLLAFAAAVFTQKRSIVIAVPISIFLIILMRKIYDKSFKSLISFLAITAVLAIAGYIVLTRTDSGKLMLNRFLNSDDVTSGRLDIYELIVNDWSDYFIFGNGPSSTMATFDTEAHNIYLQVFYENGVIGLFILLLFFSYNLFLVLKSCKNDFEKNKVLNYLLTSSFGIQLLFIIYGFFGNCLTDTYFWLLYIIFATIPFAKKKENGVKQYVDSLKVYSKNQRALGT